MNRRVGLEPAQTGRPEAVEEEVNRSVVGHVGIAQDFGGMLELVSDRGQRFVMISAGIHENPQDPVRAGNAHR
jgi:hypothetical protein